VDVIALSASKGAEYALVTRARKGDREAFEALISPRADRLIRTATAILGNAAEANDVAQEALLAGWVNLPTLRDAARFDPWLNRMLINKCRESLRRRKRSQEIELDPERLTVPDHDTASVQTASIRAAFGRLSVEDQHILLLHHLHDLPLAEVARQLSTPIGTTKSRLFRARRALERALEAEA
jgi:RNA polymerase sigma-70 factor (ECF subfamily)